MTRHERGSRRHLRFWGPDVSGDVDDELACHIALLTDSYMREGMPPELAHARAVEQFGDIAGAKRECRRIDEQQMRSARRAEWYDAIVQDLKFAVRSLRKTPAFTVVAVLALGLGIGANSAVFSMVDAAAFRPLPVERPGELQALFGAQGESTNMTFSYPALEVLRADRGPYRDFAGFAEGPVSITADAPANIVWSNMVTENYFSVLGLRPAQGRLIGGGDLRASVVVLSHALWSTQFNADPGVVGRTIRLNGFPFTIIGVAPRTFQSTRLFSYAPSLWVPVGMHTQMDRNTTGMLEAEGWSPFHVFGRLPTDASAATARATLDRVAATLAAKWPDEFTRWRITTYSNETAINPWLAPPAQLQKIGRIILLGVALVLLIACADVANLLLARMTVRRGEVSVRLALGAGRRRLIRQFLTESLVLAFLGALAAIPFAVLAVHASDYMQPRLDFATAYLPLLDVRMLVFNAIIALGAGIVFGLAPAVIGSASNLATALRNEGRGATKSGSRLREALVVTQIAVSLVVLVAAGLFTRSLERARATDPGFNADGAIVFTLDPQLARDYDDARIASLYREVERQLKQLPGVTAVSRATHIPLDGSSAGTSVFAEGSTAARDEGTNVLYSVVGDDFYDAIGSPVLEGRTFRAVDAETDVEPIIVNQAFADKLWPGQSPVGRRLRVGAPDGDLTEVIGVTRTARYERLSESPRPAFAYALTRRQVPRTTVIVRSSADPALLYPEVRRIVKSIDETLPITGLKTLRDHISVSYSAHQGGAFGATSFGVLALLLAAAGLYGVISYSVVQRRREIGVRVALGANTSSVIRMIVSGGARITAIGIIAGIALVVSVGPLLRGMLYETSPRDPFMIAGVSALLALIAFIASSIPALRAVRSNPTSSLRD